MRNYENCWINLLFQIRQSQGFTVLTRVAQLSGLKPRPSSKTTWFSLSPSTARSNGNATMNKNSHLLIFCNSYISISLQFVTVSEFGNIRHIMAGEWLPKPYLSSIAVSPHAFTRIDQKVMKVSWINLSTTFCPSPSGSEKLQSFLWFETRHSGVRGGVSNKVCIKRTICIPQSSRSVLQVLICTPSILTAFKLSLCQRSWRSPNAPTPLPVA